jgi:hypothetical protein
LEKYHAILEKQKENTKSLRLCKSSLNIVEKRLNNVEFCERIIVKLKAVVLITPQRILI